MRTTARVKRKKIVVSLNVFILFCCFLQQTYAFEWNGVIESTFSQPFIQRIENMLGINFVSLMIIGFVFLLTILAMTFLISYYRVIKQMQEEELNFGDKVDIFEEEKVEDWEPNLEKLDRGKTIDLFFKQQEEIEKEQKGKKRGKHF